MTISVNTLQEYRDQIVRCAQSLAVANIDCVSSDLGQGFTLEQVKMFVDGNLDKRNDKLLDEVELLKDAFDNLEDLVVEYVKTVPLAAYDTGGSDGTRFLQWITETQRLSLSQMDFINCQLSRHEIEDIARNNRTAHVRFQELWSTADALARQLGENPGLRIYMNPVRIWSTFQSQALLDDDTPAPARVLFFVAASDIRTSVLELSAQSLLGSLERLSPCTLDEWLKDSPHTDPDELLELCRDSAEMGIIAFG